MKREQEIPEQLQQLVNIINAQDYILAQVDLPDVIAMPDYRQVLRVQDNNIALSCEYLKISPKRILIHRTTGEELDLNLPVPLWEKTGEDVASLVDETGERILVPTNYYDDVVVNEESGETELRIIKTINEPLTVPVLKYLMFIISQKKYKEVFQLFTQQYIADTMLNDTTFYNRLN